MAWKPLEGAAGGLRLAPATLQPSARGVRWGRRDELPRVQRLAPPPPQEIRDVTESGLRRGGLFLNYFFLHFDVDS